MPNQRCQGGTRLQVKLKSLRNQHRTGDRDRGKKEQGGKRMAAVYIVATTTKPRPIIIIIIIINS